MLFRGLNLVLPKKEKREKRKDGEKKEDECFKLEEKRKERKKNFNDLIILRTTSMKSMKSI